jgi:hypothetical protein
MRSDRDDDQMSIAELREFAEKSRWGTFLEPDPSAPTTIVFVPRRVAEAEHEE